jgi:hypothetical protein
MKKQEVRKICDAVEIGKWEEIIDQPASTITHNETDTENLSGLIIYGYETKFGKPNFNGEVYDKGAISKFIQEYFVENKLNMPLTVQHSSDPLWLVGRVIYAEVTNTGFYFVGYVPKSHPQYELVKTYIEQGLLQGFSKEGWSTDIEWIDNKEEQYGGHWLIKEVQITTMSLVSTPANAVPFERVKETKNAIRFVDNSTEDTKTPRIFRSKK